MAELILDDNGRMESDKDRWCDFMKGVELTATDGKGRTAREVAVEGELNKRDFYHAIDELERGEAEA